MFPRRTLASVMCLTALCHAPAQEPDRAPPPDAAALEAEFSNAQREWNARLREASQSKDQDAMARLRAARPEAEFLPRFAAAATAAAGTDDAVPFLVWIVSRGPKPDALGAMTTLMDRHIEHAGVGRAVARIGGLKDVFGLDRSRAWLDAVLERNPDPGVRAQAHYTRAALYVGTRAVQRSEELRQLAILDLRSVLAGDGTNSIERLATGLLHEAEHLEPGLPAPEIEGEDLDGVAFKLSDYRGKVVLLDFWGDW